MYKQFHGRSSCCDSASADTIVTPQCICRYLGRHFSEEIQFLVSERLKVPASSLEESFLLFFMVLITSAVRISLPWWDEAWDACAVVIFWWAACHAMSNVAVCLARNRSGQVLCPAGMVTLCKSPLLCLISLLCRLEENNLCLSPCS